MLNEITAVGHVERDLHLIEGLNRFELCVPRKSDTKDKLIVSVFTDGECDLIAHEKIKVIGNLESKNSNGKLYVYISATSIEFDPKEDEGVNDVCLCGELCTKHSLRVTPLGKTIMDTVLRIRNSSTENFYVPVILWGDDAHKVSEMKFHDYITIEGRFQSRNYNKRISDTETRVMTAYEVSARLI